MMARVTFRTREAKRRKKGHLCGQRRGKVGFSVILDRLARCVVNLLRVSAVVHYIRAYVAAD